MPSFPIVDSHVHLYDPERFTYPWMDNVPQLKTLHESGEYDAARDGVEVDRIVFLEVDVRADQRIAEAAYVQELASEDRRIQAIVASAAIETGAAVGREIEAMRVNPALRGIRRLIQGEKDPGFCARPDFVEGVKLLAGFDLSFDLCIYHFQFPAMLELVKRCPDVRFVLDHIAKPAIRDGQRDPWMRHMRELARMPNVWCKISGATTEADHARWTRDQVAPYIAHSIECFGFDRCMFGGDWPVVELASPYKRWVDTLDDIVAGSTEEELTKLYRDTAISFYRLP
jgi:L-fuconolactonase